MRASCFLAVASLVRVASAIWAAEPSGEPVEIPLKEIWALRMEHTRPMSAGIGDPDHPEGPLLNDIRKRLPFLKEGRQPRIGFAVEGTAMHALASAHSVLTKDAPPPQVLHAEEGIFAVFFSHLMSSYVRITHVEHTGRTVQVDHQFIPHATMEMTYHFALIPLGHLAPGQYKVDYRHVDKQGDVAPVKGSPVSRSFEFTVGKRKDSARCGNKGDGSHFQR